MKFIDDLSKKDYECFVSNHPTKSHFLQSYAWGEFSRKEKKMHPYYVGLLDDKNNIVATALLLQKKLPLGFSYFYSPRGYVLDYKNKNVLTTFTKHIKNFAKKKKGIFVKIDPDIELQQLDIEGNIIDKENNNFELVKFLQQLGYKHTGYNKNFENNQPRYTFRLNLLEDENTLLNNFHATTRNILNRKNQFQLDIKINNVNDIDLFYKTMLDTERRDGIINHDLHYYKEFFTELHKENMSDLYVATVNIDSLKETYEEKFKKIEKELKLTEETQYKTEEKKKNIQNELMNQFNKAKKDLENIKGIEEKELPLTGIITTKYNDKAWIVHGGNSNKLRELNVNYIVYYEIIKSVKKEGYKTIDFFGTTGDVKESNPVYGIHLFKKRFGGKYTEFIGEFDLITNRTMYFVFNKLIPIYRKLKRKLIKRKKDN